MAILVLPVGNGMTSRILSCAPDVLRGAKADGPNSGGEDQRFRTELRPMEGRGTRSGWNLFGCR